MNKATGNRKNLRKKKERLPYGYATKVVEILANKGVQVTKSQVIDINRNKSNNKKLTKKVLNAIRKVKNDHKKEQQQLAKLRAAQKDFFCPECTNNRTKMTKIDTHNLTNENREIILQFLKASLNQVQESPAPVKNIRRESKKQQMEKIIQSKFNKKYYGI